jgi:hypothetical protein
MQVLHPQPGKAWEIANSLQYLHKSPQCLC